MTRAIELAHVQHSAGVLTFLNTSDTIFPIVLIGRDTRGPSLFFFLKKKKEIKVGSPPARTRPPPASRIWPRCTGNPPGFDG
jgi:hypothetical protein